MSRKYCCESMVRVPEKCDSPCSLTSLIILILIILQFGNKPVCVVEDDDYCESEGGFLGGIANNGILFIIALYFLSCRCSWK